MSNPDQDPIVFHRACVNHPDLSVSVSRTIVGTYRVVFRDNEADQIIETRVFNKCMSAYECAQKLINQD